MDHSNNSTWGAFTNFGQEGGANDFLTTEQPSDMLYTADHINSSPLIHQPQFPNTGLTASSNISPGTAIPDTNYNNHQFEPLDFGFPEFGEAHPNLTDSYTPQPTSWSHGGTDSQAVQHFEPDPAPLDPQLLDPQASTSGIISNQASMSGSGTPSSQMPPPPAMVGSSSSHLETSFPIDTQFVNNPLQSTSQSYPPQASTSRLPYDDTSTSRSVQNDHGLRSYTDQSNPTLTFSRESRNATPLPDPYLESSIHADLRVTVKEYLSETRAGEDKISRALFDIVKKHAGGPDVVNRIILDLQALLADEDPSRFPQPTRTSLTENNPKPSKKRKANSTREPSTTGSQTSETKPRRPFRTGISNPKVDGVAKRGRPPKAHTAKEKARLAAEKAEKEAAASQSQNPQAGPSNQPAN